MIAEARRVLLAKVHIAKKELELSDDRYLEMLGKLFGISSAKFLNNDQLSRLVAEFRKMGWTPKIPEPPEDMATVLQKRRIVRLWKQKARHRDMPGLRHWLQKYWKVRNLRALPRKQASKIIAVLESDRWKSRSGRSNG